MLWRRDYRPSIMCRMVRHDHELHATPVTWVCGDGRRMCDECMANLGADALNRETRRGAETAKPLRPRTGDGHDR